MKQKMPLKRFRNYFGIVCLTFCVSAFFAYQNSLLLDRILIDLFVNAVFLGVLFYMLESARIRRQIGKSAANDYGRGFGWYGIGCIVTAGCYFLPEFTAPAGAVALFLSLAANIEIAVGLSVFLSVMLCTATGASVYELAAYTLLALIGGQMSKTMHERPHRLFGCIIFACASCSIPPLFSYLSSSSYHKELLYWNGGFGIFAAVSFYLLSDRLYDKSDHEEPDVCERILQPDYPLVTDIKNYSKAEYVHAMKSATIAGKCAAEIQANALAATAAAFYYRLGVLEGEPFIENGVRLAEENCFPQLVIEILSEYNGEERLPSSKESAIVHMVDACLKRIELLSSQNLSSSWNQDMVIYQTLNEISATGIYDDSGLSMNQFLKIRELLVREEMGYDNTD